jgi:hyperosmotically inducible periplasmic protein
MNKHLSILVVPLLALGITACGPALVGAGAGAAAGYYVGQDERSAGEIASDAAVTARINTAFARDNLVSAWDVNVDTFRGRVTLRGAVPSTEALDRAVGIARAQKGVESVKAELEVVPS